MYAGTPPILCVNLWLSLPRDSIYRTHMLSFPLQSWLGQAENGAAICCHLHYFPFMLNLFCLSCFM